MSNFAFAFHKISFMVYIVFLIFRNDMLPVCLSLVVDTLIHFMYEYVLMISSKTT